MEGAIRSSQCERTFSGEVLAPLLTQTCLSYWIDGSRTCKPNSVRLAAGRSFLWARHYCRAQATYPKVWRTEPARIQPKLKLPPYLVLLRVGFALPAPLLWRRCALTAPFHPYLAHSQNSVSAGHETLRMGGAVSFLWHFPSTRLEPGLPDVIRHTALRSSDFPLSPSTSDSDRPVRLPTWSLYSMLYGALGLSAVGGAKMRLFVLHWALGRNRSARLTLRHDKTLKMIW